ncbi:hypothetical protein L6654_16930 [Bradyrhizobium sp. WYCCWR 13023]|uniref:Uncharacterized protein n=1 Tax=Bradyrhizobium zhengyangense TaxID=2911009 RepID=A0A9X1UAS4_9BRAD|nr:MULTISPECIES: hypothetical protein [Bradyrhizobium]MCG2628318.1 hypothetical protein [Bradyrhizobium zhengyangense]MCG2640286.1 hypothetical protein [Bradyrhizobium zhengyangense]MCG2665568.1 hypothetical protein [Bradyrhizobium zhengyangense]MDA9523263.1 hypothetical protein [Bradyrhizobium sp. CCBAU 11434]
MEHLQAYRAAGGGKHRANKQFGMNVLNRRLLMAVAVLFVTAAATSSEGKAQAGPFAPLAGSWSGSGTVSLEDGSTERIRCRAKYAPIGPTMEMTLTCASDAYKFILSANVQSAGNTITGSWSEASRNISGSLQGRGGGGNFEVVASAAGFNANIALRTSGNKQSVTMRADSQFRGANISLSR